MIGVRNLDKYSEKLKTAFDPPALVLENYIAFFSEISLDLTFLKPAFQYGRIAGFLEQNSFERILYFILHLGIYFPLVEPA